MGAKRLGLVTAPNLVAALVAACFANGASAAVDFEFGDGWVGNWTSSVSLGTSWRTHGRDPRLYSAQDGNAGGVANGIGANTIDEGNVNYGKGDAFSTLAKVFSEVEFKKGTMGGLVRAKAWYDYTLNKEGVRYGSQNNGYKPGAPLSDEGYSALNKFDGIYLLDAYVYDSYNVGGQTLGVRVGNQVVNWGESVFIQGVNQINPIDVPSFRRPGAELKEVFLPVPILDATLTLGDYGSIEGFWQLRYQETPIEAGCGNYWQVAQGMITAGGPGGCNNATPAGAGLTPAQGMAFGAWVPTLQGQKAKNDGQYGFAYRFNALDTEFGFYAMNIHARIPTVGIVYDASIPGKYGTIGAQVMGSKWTDVEDQQIFGLSATTTVMGWSVAGELSFTHNYPAQIDGNDLLGGGLSAEFGLGAVGPFGKIALATYNKFLATGTPQGVVGNTMTDKTQIQVNALQAGNGFLGAQQWIAIGEVGAQWNTLPDFHNGGSLRYNRPFIFGGAPADTGQPGGCTASGCKNDGFITKFAWGYRLMGILTYNDIFDSGITAQPKVFFSHDVKGYSVDSQFSEDRMAFSVGVKFSYDKKYTLEFSNVTYNHSAAYDPLRDRDFFSVVAGMSF